jgi:hypothetical protein
MTHPSLLSWILSAWVCLALVAFVVAHMMLASKRIVQWFDRLREERYPPSVQQTLNVLNISSDEADNLRSKKPNGI